MLAGIADVYCTQQDDYATYDEALAFAFECVAEHAFKASQEHFGEPRSIAEVMKLAPDERERWLKAAQDELQSLIENGTFKLVQLPPGRKAIGSRWVFRVKRNADGSIERYKGRLLPRASHSVLASTTTRHSPRHPSGPPFEPSLPLLRSRTSNSSLWTSPLPTSTAS